jgi:Protein of unknown function (DUF3253)
LHAADDSINQRSTLAALRRMRQGSDMNAFDSTPAIADQLDDAILKTLTQANGKTLSPPEIAHAIAGDGVWHDLLVPIRRSAVNLALAGRLVIYRKGKPADPNDFRGVYRLGLPRHD